MALIFILASCASKPPAETTIDKEEIRRSIRTSLRDVKTCYENLPSIGGTRPEGKIVLKWEIVEDGKARNVGIKSDTIGNTSLQTCMIEAIEKTKFPAPPKNQTAVVDGFPFVLKSGAPPQADPK
jgi:hypothetical protein